MILILFLITLAIVLSRFFSKRIDTFDKDGRAFLPAGYKKYDLRGFPVYNRPLFDCRFSNFTDCYNSNR